MKEELLESEKPLIAGLSKEDIDKALEGLRQCMQALVSKIVEDTGIPGISLSINICGYRISANVGTTAGVGSAEMSEDAHFQMGCISKLLTALVVAELIEAGKCDPDDPIEKYLVELRGTERGKKLAIWHLLSHTSGYSGLNLSDPRAAYYYSWSDCVEFLRTTPQLFESGFVFSYEHTEYAILSEIVSRITGADIHDLYEEMIFRPLGIKTGRVKVGDRGNEIYASDHLFKRDTMKFEKARSVPFGDFWNGSLSGITMSMSDLLRVTETLCGISKAPTAMSEKAIRFTHKQVVKLPRTYGSARHEQIPGSFGAGCAFYRGRLLGHNGSARGQTCGMRFDPHNAIALVIGMNAWQPFFRDSLISGIFGILRGKAAPPFPEEPFESSLDDLAGIYIGPQGCAVVAVREGEDLICELRDRDKSALKILLRRDDKGILRVLSDTQHHSLGFFNTPDTGAGALMLGMTAFRKQSD